MQSILLFHYLPSRPGWKHLATHIIPSLQLQPLKKLIYATSLHLGMEKDPDPPTHHLPLSPCPSPALLSVALIAEMALK